MNGDSVQFRRRVYALLITVAAGAVAGRILAAELVNEPSVPRAWPATKPKAMPTFGSNDRSRWATVRALVDGDLDNDQPPGTFVIGRRDRKTMVISAVTPLAATDPLTGATLVAAAFHTRAKNSDRGIIFEDGWQSVDKVLHPAKLEFYSSKPPLLSVIMAGLYWLLQQVTGWKLATHPFAVVRTLLLLVNLLPFVIYLLLLSRLVERCGRSDWGKVFVMAGACFATFVTTFAVTFNNHSIGTYSAVFALYAAVKILDGRLTALAGGSRLNGGRWYWFVLAGFFASFTACCELPAAAFALAVFVILLRWAPGRTLALFVPAAAIPLAASLITNYLALGQLRPAYSEFGGPWYEYEGSHWRKPEENEIKGGIDWAGTKETRAEYAFHVLFGHHGLFSLTPIWLLAIVGALQFSPGDLRLWILQKTAGDSSRADVRARQIRILLAVLTLYLSIVVVGFYLSNSDNYGGWTSSLRWLIWLSPFWLLSMLSVADWLAERRWGRAAAYLLLGLSVMSVSYPAWNPWRHPWIYRLMEAMGWPGY
jgi:hypothetical protein